MAESAPMSCSQVLAAMAVVASLCGAVNAQPGSQAIAPANSPAPRPDAPYVFRVTTREVVVDVIAVDSHQRPVTDLQLRDFEVFDRAANSDAVSQTVSSLHLFDPTDDHPSESPESGFRIAANESCLQRNSLHYELAYHPGANGLIGGNHHVLIRTSRRGVRLFYLHHYFVGATTPPERAPMTRTGEIAKDLQIDACSHPLDPLSISLRAVRIATGSTDLVRYSVNIESGSLAFVSFSDNGRQLQLDYGACNFNAAGQPINYMSASTDQVLSPVEYARADAHGFHRIFEFAPPKDIAMTRFVVRDRVTGNLGLTDVTFPLPERSPLVDPVVVARLDKEALLNALAKARQKAAADTTRAMGYSASSPSSDLSITPPTGPIGSFGSVVPRSHAFCGDVYEFQPNTPRLPDFRDLDPIGSIYTDALAVPDQIFLGTNGIPGVTDRTVWFGIDYHGALWIDTPGEYQFMLVSDDGALLQIDDRQIIDMDGLHVAQSQIAKIRLAAGRHSIHVPYYEGTPNAVALELWVRRPGKDWELLDLREFAAPEPTTNPQQP